MLKDFCIFILTHGRPKNVKTYDLLKKIGCKSKIILVLDNEDDSISEYFDEFGVENCYVFDKLKISKTFDAIDISDCRETIVYARNACFDIAAELEYKYFLELDDDYTSFSKIKIDGKVLRHKEIKNNIDYIFLAMINFLEKTNALSVCFSQGGDFIGGTNSGIAKQKIRRKAMNSFFCKTSNKFQFIGRINEDVNTYTSLGRAGNLFFTIYDICLRQTQTQSSKGGMTDVYLNDETFLKSFFSVVCCPSCVKISTMGNKYKRIHHKVLWNNCCPKILNEKCKKRCKNGKI